MLFSVLFFFCVLPRPSTFTVVPHPTLFRSHVKGVRVNEAQYDHSQISAVPVSLRTGRRRVVYHAWAVAYVRLMKRSNLATRLIEPLARWRAEEISFRMKSRSRPHYRGRVVRWLGEPVCWLLGTALGWVGDPDRFYPQPKADQNKI